MISVRNIVKRFGGVTAVDDCSLEVNKGTITAVIGPNGAGKTTLFNVINGIYTATGGKVRFKGRDITNWPVHAIAAIGMGRTFQVARVFNEMSLLDNMLVPAIRTAWTKGAAEARASELLAMARLDHLKHQPAVEISGGQKKLLEFVRTMMNDPDLILLDEPFNGISPALIEVLIDMIKTLNARGKTFLLISHEMPHVGELCEQVWVLSAGSNIAHGTPDEVRADPAVIDAYLGQ